MAFRLIYEGELLSANAGDKTAVRKNKHAIRKQLHPQLKRLWQTDKHLHFHAIVPVQGIPIGGLPISNVFPTNLDYIAKKYERCGNGFVPLIEPEGPLVNLYVSLDILFLRRERPGAIIKGGDLDNRMKTFFDGLKIPENCEDITEPFEVDECPMYCLLCDDKLISEVKITTDLMLRPASRSSRHDLNQVMLVVQVNVGRYGETWY